MPACGAAATGAAAEPDVDLSSVIMGPPGDRYATGPPEPAPGSPQGPTYFSASARSVRVTAVQSAKRWSAAVATIFRTVAGLAFGTVTSTDADPVGSGAFGVVPQPTASTTNEA